MLSWFDRIWCGWLGWFGGLFNKAEPAEKIEVIYDDRKISYSRPDGKKEEICWDELQAVEIVTTDTGPFLEDVYWLLHGKGRGCAIPQGAVGMRELLEKLQQLPEFDNQAVINAMSSTDNAKFPCWHRDRDKIGEPDRDP